MQIRFLGTGTSTGVPEVGCRCQVCMSRDKRDQRLRASAIVRTHGKNILIDCGPDFRYQMLQTAYEPIEGVLLTHEHYDHVGGIDDLRPFCRFGDIEIYAEDYVADAIMRRIPYCFTEFKYPGIPSLILNRIQNKPFFLGNIEITPIRVMHSKLPIFGYRIGRMAYITDLKTLPDEELSKLKDLDVLIINALRIEEHLSHQNVAQALVLAEQIGARQTYFIHMSHHFGLHADMEKKMPTGVFIAYDGLEIEVEE